MPDQERQPKDLRIPLHVEEVSVSRREIKKANVRIALITGTREQLIDEELTRIVAAFLPLAYLSRHSWLYPRLALAVGSLGIVAVAAQSSYRPAACRCAMP
jgi:hypothetical protein